MDRKQIKELREAAADQGWREEAKKDGVMLFPPDKTKEPVMIHFTPSDYRADRNTIAALRRSGLVWKGR